MTLHLANARHVDATSHAIRAGHLAVAPGPGGGVTFVDAIPRDAQVFDCGGRLVTRAFANAHHHVYSALARGMPAPPRTPTSFVEILQLI